MRNLHLLCAILFLMTVSISGQQNKEVSRNLPVSIYTFNIITKDAINFSSIQKKIDFTDFQFVYASVIDMDTNTFSIDTKNIGKRASKFIYDDYRRYQDRNLLKGFLEKNDPTRWNLQCQQNNL